MSLFVCLFICVGFLVFFLKDKNIEGISDGLNNMLEVFKIASYCIWLVTL